MKNQFWFPLEQDTDRPVADTGFADLTDPLGDASLVGAAGLVAACADCGGHLRRIVEHVVGELEYATVPLHLEPHRPLAP
ncbi:MAG: hypothetical protein Q4G36_04315 [Paracoccus sp. (in: a-proteobacteria)]|nr:hypothetical protein [Paracoccus sp. (in: a-proteobacteria)]